MKVSPLMPIHNWDPLNSQMLLHESLTADSPQYDSPYPPRYDLPDLRGGRGRRRQVAKIFVDTKGLINMPARRVFKIGES
jgi:hypothetical protein